MSGVVLDFNRHFQARKEATVPVTSDFYMSADLWNRHVGWGTVPEKRDTSVPENQEKMSRLIEQECGYF